MSRRTDWLSDLSAAIAERRWKACPKFLYRVLYGVPAAELLPLTAEVIQYYLPVFERRWPEVKWPGKLFSSPQDWIQRFGRALPDEPDFELASDAQFKFSLDAILLAWSYPQDLSILASSYVCGMREALGATAKESATNVVIEGECGGCGDAEKSRSLPPDPESPIEFARSRGWQSILDEVIARNLHTYPDVQSTDVLEADLAQWERRAMLLIVPVPALVSAQR